MNASSEGQRRMRRSPRRKRSTAAGPVARSSADADPVSLVRVERRDHVALLSLHHPPVNVLSVPLLEELVRAVIALADDARTRAIVIASDLEGFSGGADIQRMVGMDRAEAIAFSLRGQAVANLLERVPLAVIAAVNGFCFGGGCELVQACDFIVASEDAFFGQPEIKIGVIPGWGGSRRLTRAIGPVRARHWILTGERVSAADAFAAGLVDRVVPKPKLLDTALELAQKLAAQSAVALAAAKYAVNQAADPGRLLGLEYERELWGKMFEMADQKEGMRAFLEKRPPAFTDERDIHRRQPAFPWERPGNPLEVTKSLLGTSKSTPTANPRTLGLAALLDPTAWAEAYRETGLEALEAFFRVWRSVNDSYRFWAGLVLPVPPDPSAPRPAAGRA